jgi:CRP/FNR family transcriptional regulator, cyclic AMP receptor protein
VRYFFHVTEGDSIFKDRAGRIFSQVEDAKAYAAVIAIQLARETDQKSFSVQILDDNGIEVARLPIGQGRSPVLESGGKPPFDPMAFLAKAEAGKTIPKYQMNQNIFSQGDLADSVFYIRHGKVKVTVMSEQGKEAVIAILGPDEFCGEGCLAGQSRRIATATAMADCEIMRMEKAAIIRLLHDEPAFSEIFVSHLLARTIRIEEDLVDQLFNSSEKRLARALLLLANFGKEGRPEPIVPNVSQEMLAEMIGTTRSRVNFFMNKFRQLGFVEYNGTLKVHSSLLSVVLHDQPEIKK